MLARVTRHKPAIPAKVKLIPRALQALCKKHVGLCAHPHKHYPSKIVRETAVPRNLQSSTSQRRNFVLTCHLGISRSSGLSLIHSASSMTSSTNVSAHSLTLNSARDPGKLSRL